jgi:pimeloyl-ACP methyl ester carboxylesterase
LGTVSPIDIDRPGATDGSDIMSVTSKDGTVIAHDHRGQGPLLIVVDGALTTRSGEFKPELTGLLAPHFSVIDYDRRGRGESDDTQPYAVAREIEDIEALIDHAGGSAYLYGHSSGACLAFYAAVALPDKVDGVAAYEAPWNDDPASQKAWGEYLRGLKDALTSGRGGDAVALFMEYVGTPPDQVAGMRQAPFWPSLEAIAPTLAYDHAEIIGPTAAVPGHRLAAVSVPVLAMCGSTSMPFMCTTARTIAEAVPNGRFVTLEGQSHAVQPPALAPVLIDFFVRAAEKTEVA